MVEFVGKILPGIIAMILCLKGLSLGAEIGTTNTILFGFMGLWGAATFYYPMLDAIDEMKDYIHLYAAKKLGIAP